MDKKKGNKGLLIGLCVFLSILMGAMILVAVYADFLLDRIGRYDENKESVYTPEQVATMTEDDPFPTDFSGPTYAPEDVPLLPDAVLPPADTDAIVNILLIGQDRRQGEGRQRSDTMILCTFHKEKGTITMTSFLRDLYVSIPGYKANKLNAAYKWGGMPLLTRTLYENFGVEVDACVEVDFGGFVELVDLVGGVEITLTEQESRYLQTVGNFAVRPGKNRLTGEQALFYARLRKLDDDFHRTQRQRNVLSALLKSCSGLSLPQMHNLLMTALPMVVTDMTNGEMVAYLMELFPLITAGEVKTLQIPAEGMYEDARVGNMQVLLTDPAATRDYLRQELLGWNSR